MSRIWRPEEEQQLPRAVRIRLGARGPDRLRLLEPRLAGGARLWLEQTPQGWTIVLEGEADPALRQWWRARYGNRRYPSLLAAREALRAGALSLP